MSDYRYADFVNEARSRTHAIPAAELEQLRQAARAEQRSFHLIDVREPSEVESGSIPGSVFLPRGLVEKHVADVLQDRDAPVYIVCETGHRSVLVADVLQRMGYRDVHNLQGGLVSWRAANLPMEATGLGGEDGESCMTSSGLLTWPQIRAEFPIVRRRVPVMGDAERPLLYLDHAASTHAPSCVIERYAGFMSDEYANIHRGTHVLSRAATDLFDDCYYVVSDFIGGNLEQDCVTFLTNTTQAIDLAAHAMAEVPGKVIVTELEHHSNDLPHRKRGPVLRARCAPDGSLDMEHLASLLRHNEVKLVAVTGASNLTGWMPDVHAIARMAHDAGARILVDCAQLLAHMPIDVKASDDPEHLDFIAAAGHKAYAPFGSSFLYGPRDLLDAAPPYLPGGGTASRVSPRGVEYVRSPDRHQGGTPNIGGVIAMAEAIKFLDRIGMERVREHELELTSAAMERLSEIPGVTIYGPPNPADRLGVLTFNVEGVSDLLAAAALSEERAIACRNGRFCAHPYMDFLIRAQGGATPEPGANPGACRASFGLYNTMDDVDRLVEGVKMLQSRSWVARYRVKANDVTAEFAGRCNDRWMEADLAQGRSEQGPELLFEQLNHGGPCRTYLIADPKSNKAMLVDPRRDQVDAYVDLLRSRGLQLEVTVETQTHDDHLSGSKRLKEIVGCQMAMHHTSSAPCVDRPLEDGDTIQIGELSVDVWSTPGHTRDSICLLLPDRVITGDTILIDGCGLTLSGDPRQLFQSLSRFDSLPGHLTVWPSHVTGEDRPVTLADLREQHPLLGVRDLDEFLAREASQRAGGPVGTEDTVLANARCL